MYDIEMWVQSRKILVKFFRLFSEEQLLEIPFGFNNNLAWNFGHILQVHQSLIYKLSGLTVNLNDWEMDHFANGSSPKQWDINPDFDRIEFQLLNQCDQLKSDISKDIFKYYKGYTTSKGIYIPDFESALAFNFFHEGLHTGMMMSMRKLLMTKN